MWDSTYDRAEYLYGEEPNDFLKESVKSLPSGRILCLADGEGRNSVYLASLGYEVTAVDLSSVAIQKARKLAESRQVRVNFVHADLADFELGRERWDGIVSIFCHLPPELRKSLHHAVQQGLKRSGVYLVKGYTPKQLLFRTGGPPRVDMLLSAQILSGELQQLHPLMLTERERFIQEGTLHNGHSHVVQGVFIKVPKKG